MIIGYTVPEICCMMDVIVIFHFGLFFCPFTPLTAWKIKISKKWKKHLQISSFYTSVPKTSDYMLYCSWDMARDGCNCCFSFWAIFCPFTPVTVQKIKISTKKKRKKSLEISLSTTVPKIMIISYTVPEIWHMRSNYFSFWAIFCPFTLLTAQKIKISKNEENNWRSHHFTHVYQNYN